MSEYELRDWFAGLALYHLMGAEHGHYVWGQKYARLDAARPQLAAEAYKVAEAMIHARNHEKGTK